ncbi:MAG: NDP-sugar synthase [Candidatus Poseidoniaceae archaeon]|nr:NDP-sugar synthase [Candidatus Poseidoniaceae archaeon]
MGMQVVVLAGGFGSRLKPWTNTVPKPLLPLLDKTLLEQVVSTVPEDLVDEVVIAAGYMVDEMRQYFSSIELPYEVTILPEDEPMGTGGALKNCIDHVSGRFACFNGDVVSSLDFSAMAVQHEGMKAIGTLALWEVEDPTRFGIVGIDEDYRVTRFKEKPTSEEVFSNLINAGSYILEEEIFELMPEGKFSLEREVFPVLAERGELGGFPFEGFFIDAGTPESWTSAVEAAIKDGRFASGSLIEGTWFADGEVADCIRGEYNMFSSGIQVSKDSIISQSTLLEGAKVGSGARLERCLIGENAQIGAGCQLKDVLVDHGAIVPDGSLLQGGTFPQIE